MMMGSNIQLKFQNGAQLQKRWGSPKPPELERIFLYLIETGFQGPRSWKDPTTFSFDRPLDDDLFVRVAIGSVGEYPSGVFNFDTTIFFYSRYIEEIESSLDLWEREQSGVDQSLVEREPYAALFSITLSHLKWNAVPGGNPKWSIMAPNSSQQQIDSGWIADWKAYGETYLGKIKNTKDLVDTLTNAESYKRSPWVKSDGMLGVSIMERTAILLTRLGRRDEAKKLLAGWQINIDRPSGQFNLSRAAAFTKRRVQKILRWIG